MPRFQHLVLYGLAVAGLTMTVAAQTGGVPSPPMDTSITIGGKHIKISYYAPSMRGRKIMGDLVPYNEVWCTGANWNTTITADADLEVGGLKLPKGTYGIWTLPGPKEWLLIVSNDNHQFHLDYKPEHDLGRTKMNLKTLPKPVETFKIELMADGGNKGTLALMWENTEASIPFTVGK